MNVVDVMQTPPFVTLSRKPLHPQHSSETQGRLHSFIQSFASIEPSTYM